MYLYLYLQHISYIFYKLHLILLTVDVFIAFDNVVKSLFVTDIELPGDIETPDVRMFSICFILFLIIIYIGLFFKKIKQLLLL